MSSPPDFVGLGVQGAGIGWWSQMLASHPDIRMPETTALNHFQPFCEREMTAEDVGAYHAAFADEGMRGEWSARYLYDFWTPPLLRRAAPAARLLVILRDPLERFRAGLAHQRRAVAKRKDQLATTDAIERGRYGEQLRLWRDHFPAEQMLVLQYERIARDPAGEYQRMLHFLSVDPSHRPPELAGGPPEEPLSEEPWPDLRQGIVDTLRDDVRELASLVPDLDLSLWPDFAGVR